MSTDRKYLFYFLGSSIIITIIYWLAGFFEIGLLSDDYLNFYQAVNSTFWDKILGKYPLTQMSHVRTIFFLSLDLSSFKHSVLNFSYDNFLFYKIQNLLLLFLSAYFFGKSMLIKTKHLSISVLMAIAVCVFPNGIINICWTVGRVDLISCLFLSLIIYNTFMYIERSDKINFISIIIVFTLALFTKETALIFPVVIGLLVFFNYNKSELAKLKGLFYYILILMIVYLVIRVVFLRGNVFQTLSMFQEFPFANAPGVYARSLISLTLPFDYLSLQLNFRNKDFFLILYLVSLYSAVFYLFYFMIKNDNYKYFTALVLIGAVSVSPYLFAGYFRPNLALITFCLMFFQIIIAYDTLSSFTIKLNKLLLRTLCVVVVLLWVYYSVDIISQWKYAYSESKIRIDNLLAKDIQQSRETYVVGNPGRFKQAYLFDKLTGAYNFWKYKSFVVKDTLNDAIQTGALDEASLNSIIQVNKTGEHYYEITATGATQYFYIEGRDFRNMSSGFRNALIEAEFFDFDVFNKPKRLKIKILSPSVELYVSQGLDYVKLN